MSETPDTGAGSTVVIYRELWLPTSETFIETHAGSLARYSPLRTGIRRDPSGLPSREVVLLEDYGINNGDRLLRLMRSPSGRWLDRIRKADPVLVHAHFGPDSLYASLLAAELRVPLVATFHGYDISTAAWRSPGHFIWSILRPVVFRRAARVITVSQFAKDRLIRAGCEEEKISVVHNGVDTETFRPDRSVMRQPVILFVGRLIELKGCDRLIRAVAAIESSESVEIVVIGDGPERDSLEALAVNLGVRVRFLGIQSPAVVREWMNRARIFSVPSVSVSDGTAESFGVVFLEAQSMELPVVSFVHGGIPEVVEDGITGLLAEEGSVDGLAACLTTLLEDDELRSVMGRAGRERVERHFGVASLANRLESIYDEVIEAVD